ncbi:MAG TPA: glycosyltransferase family 1 protein [Chthoniobacterales bacterium]|nr:glycosyltransferase family 1 protein [Chthoniobacterales bacterium]
MVLLIGNYAPDQQQSMQRFNAMMLQGLIAAGVDAELIRPQPIFGQLNLLGQFAAKWLGYIDKYILFPIQLKRKLRARPEVVHICDHSNAVYVKRCRRFSVLVTCHDLLAVRGALGEETDCPASFTGRILQRWILRGLQRADAVACISEATADDADRLIGHGVGRPHISVVRMGLNYPYKKLPTEVARVRLGKLDHFNCDFPFALHVGSNLRRKNRDGVLRIFAKCREKWNGRLVFAGDLLNEDLLTLAGELGIADRVIQLHNPESEVLEILYNCATALIYPSRFEGFGWPIIEAQACGCPVICTNSGPLPEAAGDAGFLHRVEDEDGFATDLLRLTNPTKRAIWSEGSLRHAEKFSTDKMIAQYLDIYRHLGAEL